MPNIHVNTSSPYDIYVGDGILPKAGNFIDRLFIGSSIRAAVITDDTVNALYAKTLCESLSDSGIEHTLFSFPHGERHKTLKTVTNIYKFLANSQITRGDMVIALGGGVVGDVAGFAAATFLRGIRLIMIPTTLLSAVDSSVGGKNGVDLPFGKNLVGTFLQPSLVICDPDTLSTLPPETFADGAAEVLKYGAIYESELFDEVKSGALNTQLSGIISRSIKHKQRVVEADEFETGERIALNFGHTIGHAIEKQSDFTVSHGRAVGIGMALITKLSEKLSLTEKGTYEKLSAALSSLSLPCEYDCSLPSLAPIILNDKKRRGRFIKLVLLRKIGEYFVHELPVSELPGFLAGGE